MLMKLMMVIRLYSVDVSYPPGLEDLINAFKLCATVRLFLQVIILSYFSYFFYIHTKFCWCGCKNIGIGNRQLANKHFQTFISFLENFTNGTRTFFLTLMLEFSSTLMRWFSKTRPSFGTGSFSLDNKNLSSNRFRLFTPFTALAIAPVEAHYSRDLVGDSHTYSISGKKLFCLPENQHPLLWPARTRS